MNPSSIAEKILNVLKPKVRPLYSHFVLNPAIQILLPTTTVEKSYGQHYPKYYLFPSETIPTPEVKEMPPFDDPFKYLEGETYTTPDIYSVVLENVLFEPGNGVVLDSSRKILTESLYPHMDTITIAGALLNKNFVKRRISGKPIQKITGYCSLYQGLPNGYYHKFIDLIPRCYLLNQPEYQDIPEIKLLYTEPYSETERILVPRLIPDNVTLTPLTEGNQLYEIEKLILPTFFTEFGSGYLPKPYLQKLREECLPKRPSQHNKRIYISRAKSAQGLKKRHILNEDELFNILQRFGFERYQLEDFSLLEKIELFYDAETVIGAYGGGLTHILFSEQVNVLELQIMAKTQTYYYYLAKALGHRYEFLFSDRENNRENFTVNISSVMDILEQWFS